MIDGIKKILKNKRFLYLTGSSLLILFALVLNIAFSAFTNKQTKEAANIIVGGMKYAMKIDGVSQTKFISAANEINVMDIEIESQNSIASAYELTYKVCSNANCTDYIDSPIGFEIQYSEDTIDPITGTIDADGSKVMRVAIINDGSSTVYVEFTINAGYVQNTLALTNMIKSGFSESESVLIALYVDGEKQPMGTDFPTNKPYSGSTCSGAVPYWNSVNKTLSVSNLTKSTECRVYFGSNSPVLAYRILSDNSLKTGADFSIAANSAQSGLYSAEDNYGTSYYFRGSVNNNVIFGGYQWKIIRIDGNGNIKLIYNGTEAEFTSNRSVNTDNNTTYENSAFNLTNNQNKYVGFIVDSAASTIKNSLDTFYNNLSDEAKERIVNALYCNDKSPYTKENGQTSGGGTGTTTTYYGSFVRLDNGKAPSLKCPRNEDNLELNIGLISADEVAMAGGLVDTANGNYYLKTGKDFWTMSPSAFIADKATNFYVSANGSLANEENYNVNNAAGVRPVITVNAGVIFSEGNGSATNPYRVS